MSPLFIPGGGTPEMMAHEACVSGRMLQNTLCILVGQPPGIKSGDLTKVICVSLFRFVCEGRQ